MADRTRRSGPDAAGSLLETWRRLNVEQRVAAVGALLLVLSTFGPFSFVEAAIALTGLAVLLLLRKRGDRKRFHLPFGDGTVILAAGVWSALLIVVRLFDRPFGQSALALACAATLAAAGLRERAKHPPDDVPEPESTPESGPTPGTAPTGGSPAEPRPATARVAAGGEPTTVLGEREPGEAPEAGEAPAAGEAPTTVLGERYPAAPPAAGDPTVAFRDEEPEPVPGEPTTAHLPPEDRPAGPAS